MREGFPEVTSLFEPKSPTPSPIFSPLDPMDVRSSHLKKDTFLKNKHIAIIHFFIKVECTTDVIETKYRACGGLQVTLSNT